VAKEKSWFKRLIRSFNLTLWLVFFLILVIAYSPLSQTMLKPLTVREDLRPADVIVVLADGVDAGRYLTLDSSHQMVRGAQLYFNGLAKKILFAGGLSKRGGVAESTVLAQEAGRLNIPGEAILLEKRSQNLREQVMEIKKIMEPPGWKSLLLVTSSTRMKRALMAFENAGFKVYPAPGDPYEKYIEDPLGRLRLFSRLIQEYLGLLYYQIRGWI
jgi:uncharacterized SAM-binding protein YcdF (DUF218 family)